MIAKQRLEETEKWIDIPEFYGRYSINNYGDIRANDFLVYHKGIKEKEHTQLIKGKKLKSHKNRGGYLAIRLVNKDGERKSFLVHRIVAQLFVPNSNKKDYVNHIDGDKANNYYKNLEWVTAQENNIHAWRTGLKVITEKMRESAKTRIIKTNKSRCKKVYQYDKEYKLLKVFDSVKEASYELGISNTCISEVCNGKQKSSRGYIFNFGE